MTLLEEIIRDLHFLSQEQLETVHRLILTLKDNSVEKENQKVEGQKES